ncbi:MAG: hypothetical protein NC191_10580 [Muribaculaceae bacterium]|nr:hypothetical protein [Muribaculaceae bacterium]
MTLRSNLLLITDDSNVSRLILDKLVLLRSNDAIETCNYKDYKKLIEKNPYYVVILHQSEDDSFTLKTIKNIKDISPEIEILLLLNGTNKELVLNSYDNGIFDYIYTGSEDYEMLIKTVNCFKIQTRKEKEHRDNKFLAQLGVLNSKTKLYEYKYLREIFIDLSDNLRIQNGVFAVVTLDDKTKTKISTNRLALAINNSLRGDDIGAIARGGKFYLILPNTDIASTKAVIEKIQSKMGEDFQLRAGHTKIGNKSFETLDKISNDGLISAIQNEVMTVCLELNKSPQNAWLDDEVDNQPIKEFKLFKTILKNKLENLIIPTFYRYQKEFETKLTNTKVSQYANDIECVFSLKNEKLHSELIIRYDGYAKFNIKIEHSGLDTTENSHVELPLNKLTNKQLAALLQQLKTEYKKSTITKGK